MKIKLVQDSIIFISSLKKDELGEALRFCPESTTLCIKDVDTKKSTPVCAVAYAAEGSVSDNGIVFDSVTDDGFMCKTLVATEGFDEHLDADAKIKSVSETFASLILKMNTLEDQIKKALEVNAARITDAKQSIEIINL